MTLIRCPHCHTILAETDGAALYCGVATIHERTALACRACAAQGVTVRVVWYGPPKARRSPALVLVAEPS